MTQAKMPSWPEDLLSLFLNLWLWPKHHPISLKTSLFILKRLFWKSERTLTVSSFHFLSNDLLILKAMLMPLTEKRKGHDKKEMIKSESSKMTILRNYMCIYIRVYVCVSLIRYVFQSLAYTIPVCMKLNIDHSRNNYWDWTNVPYWFPPAFSIPAGVSAIETWEKWVECSIL